MESVAEHDQGRDAGFADGVGDAPRAVDVERERLLEHERLAGVGGPHGEVGLRDRGDLDRDRIARVEQRIDVVERAHTERAGGVGRVRRCARPHADETGLRTGRERRTDHVARPASRADEPDAQCVVRRHGSCSSRGRRTVPARS